MHSLLKPRLFIAVLGIGIVLAMAISALGWVPGGLEEAWYAYRVLEEPVRSIGNVLFGAVLLLGALSSRARWHYAAAAVATLFLAVELMPDLLAADTHFVEHMPHFIAHLVLIGWGIAVVAYTGVSGRT